MINDLGVGDKVIVTREIICMCDMKTTADVGMEGRLDGDSEFLAFIRPGYTSVHVYSSNRYDLTGCLEWVAGPKGELREMTVAELEEALGHPVKVVK